MKHVFILFFSGFLFAQNTVLDSAHIAQAVYQEVPQTEFELLHEHESHLFGNRLMAFYDSKADTVYISVRGTTKLQNWISNTHVGTAGEVIDSALNWLIPAKYKKHYDTLKEGSETWFVLAFKNLKDEVESLLKQHPHAQVVFTGHSYGGLMANLLAQDAYHRHPGLKFKCHTFNAPGALEIREKSLKIPKTPQEILGKRFSNHVRMTDVVGNTNTHEGNVLKYKPAFRKDLLGAHAIGYFVEDLEAGMKPISKAESHR